MRAYDTFRDVTLGDQARRCIYKVPFPGLPIDSFVLQCWIPTDAIESEVSLINGIELP